MADGKITLALAFIQSHPQSAARILEQHNLEDVAEFIQGLPPIQLTPMIQKMLPQFIGRLCKLLDHQSIINLLSHVELSYLAAVLRILRGKERDSLLTKFPTGKRAACSLLLSFAEDTVGAWQTPLVVTIPDDCNVKEALHYVKVAGDVLHADYVFVVDRNRTLKGKIRYIDLLRADPDQVIQALVDNDRQSLSGRMTLRRAEQHHCWESVDVMPINNRSNQFIGVLRHVDLRKGLEVVAPNMSEQTKTDPLSGLFDVYGDTMIALLNSLGDVFESESKK